MTYRFKVPDEERCTAELPDAKTLPALTGRWCPNVRAPGEQVCAWHAAKRDHVPEPDCEQGGLF